MDSIFDAPRLASFATLLLLVGFAPPVLRGGRLWLIGILGIAVLVVILVIVR